MKPFIFLLFTFFITCELSAQSVNNPSETKIMTLGVFHFAFHNLDVVRTEKEDQISVLDEPYQSEIIAISNAVKEFRPTIIAVELDPDNQHRIDSLYSLYKSGNYVLEKNEVDQLGFRIGKLSGIERIYCVNDWGKHYGTIETLFNDSTRMSKFSDYYEKSADSIYGQHRTSEKVSNVIDELIKKNNPEAIRDDLSSYLLTIFKYEEQPGDFTGVDFETGRWFNRNLRIFRNIQRIPHDSDDRILLIIGAGHLNLLNHFFDISSEFDLVSPLPYLEEALNKQSGKKE